MNQNASSGVYKLSIYTFPSSMLHFSLIPVARRGSVRFLLCSLLGLTGATLLAPTAARAESALCADGMCQPAISKTTFFARPAYRLTDGKTEAIIVPQIGRIMRYGKVGGPNLLWNSPTPKGIDWGWINYGGDKNWLSPQSQWPAWQGANWPPDKAHDGKPHKAEVLSGGKLRLTSPLSTSTGIRFSRILFFNEAGELVIQQTAIKEKGAPIRAGIWSITQIVPGDAVFLPVNQKSSYKNGYYWQMKKTHEEMVSRVGPDLLRYEPKPSKHGSKVGVDSTVSAIASVRDGVAFVQKSPLPAGQYPDGADGAGFPVEFYHHGDPKVYYAELELLGPLKNFKVGGKSTHTMRWSLHDLPSKNVNSPTLVKAVRSLIYSP